MLAAAQSLATKVYATCHNREPGGRHNRPQPEGLTVEGIPEERCLRHWPGREHGAHDYVTELGCLAKRSTAPQRRTASGFPVAPWRGIRCVSVPGITGRPALLGGRNGLPLSWQP